MKKLALVALLALAVLAFAAANDTSFTVDTEDVAWQPLELEGMPPGIELRPLHENPRTQMSNSMARYPKGFVEPRHYHKTCGHYIYVLEGRIRSPEGDLTPGMFTYAAPNEEHGPYTAIEPSKVLFYTDGPFDFILAK